MPQSDKKIKACTFRASSIGDCLMGKFFLENIKAAFPQAECFLIVASKSAMIRDLLSDYPWITVSEASRRNPLSILRLFAKTKKSDYTLTQYTKGRFSLTSKIFARLITKRGSFFGWNDSFKLNHILFDKVLDISKDKSMVEHEVEVLRSMSIGPTIMRPTLKTPADFQEILQKFKLAGQRYIILHLFSGSQSRGLTQDNRLKILRELQQGLNNQFKIVLTGGADNSESVHGLLMQLGISAPPHGTGQVVNLSGLTTVRETIGLIHGSLFVVSVDTGVAHIAAHLSKDLLVMRTCVGKQWWYKSQYNTANIDVLECDSKCTQGHVYNDSPACLNGIDFDGAIAKVISRFSRNSTHA